MSALQMMTTVMRMLIVPILEVVLSVHVGLDMTEMAEIAEVKKLVISIIANTIMS